MTDAIPIDSLDDPRVAPYRNLKDRELAALGDRFIAEGEFVVRRLLASDHRTDSVLLARRRVAEIAPLVPAGVPVYALDDGLIRDVIGFAFHSGVMACGIRKPSPSVDDVMRRTGSSTGRVTLLVCPETANADNMGSLLRIAAAFGVTAVVLGERSCDPYWRRAVRVSMGTIFSLAVVRCDDLMSDLRVLKQRWSVVLAATVTDADAAALESTHHPGRLGLLLGGEAQGLDRRWIDVCDRRVTIPMQLGTDSLNVAIAAGVFLYHYTRIGCGD